MSDHESLRIVVPRYGAEVLGGSESLMRAIATRLAGQGWSVEVWTSCAHSERTWANVEAPGLTVDRGVTVRRFRTALARHPGAFALAGRGFFRLPAPLRPERAWIAAQGPWMPSLVRALRMAPARPTVFVPYLYHPTIVGLPAAAGVRILQPAAHDERPLRLRLVGRAVAAADAIWYGTPEERALLERVHPEAARRPQEIGTVAVEAPVGVDPAAFARRNGLHSPYLLYAGRATDGKGVATLTTALDLLRRTHPTVLLVLAGDQSHRPDPARGVVAVGRLPRNAFWEALAGASAVLVPSPMESLSLVTLEAWAVGRPALVNAASAVLAGHAARSRGALEYRGPADLAAAAARLLDAPQEGDALGRAGNSHLRSEYAWDAVVDRVRRLIAVTPGRRRPR